MKKIKKDNYMNKKKDKKEKKIMTVESHWKIHQQVRITRKKNVVD